MTDEIKDAIESNATGPKSVTADGVTVNQHSIKDQIVADNHVATKTAAKRKHAGVRFMKMSPPGTV